MINPSSSFDPHPNPEDFRDGKIHRMVYCGSWREYYYKLVDVSAVFNEDGEFQYFRIKHIGVKDWFAAVPKRSLRKFSSYLM